MAKVDDPVVPRPRTDLAIDAYEIPLSSLGVVCIPSDGKVVLSHTDHPNRNERLSVQSYPSASAAIDALYAGTVEWGPWA